ncbi:hypothetical protein [Nitrospirillum iridis]|uniref:Uncharacterized protein n=1 Tax=Nitrospirillum iridis TaxID=765888 RepID=A0A7X0ATF6_9PROT|nr:hypothetical protein [Nitrospirillum iridis]MBB6249753.1 hypothetical protein [Nitrospirillum iridis]
MKRLLIGIAVCVVAAVALGLIVLAVPFLRTLATVFVVLLAISVPPKPGPVPHDMLDYKVEKELPFSQPTGVAWNGDGSRLAVLMGRSLAIVDTHDWHTVGEFSGIGASFSRCAFSPRTTMSSPHWCRMMM